MNKHALPLAALALLLAPPASRALDLTAEVYAGFSHQDATGAVGFNAGDARNLLNGGYNATGVDLVLNLGGFELGALYEGGLSFDAVKSGNLAGLFGFGFDLPLLRLEALGEIGGHRFSDIGTANPSVQGDTSAWLPYVGVRPGASVRFPLGPVRLIAGAWVFARWDVARTDVTVSSGGQPTTYHLGGSNYGITGRLGVEF